MIISVIFANNKDRKIQPLRKDIKMIRGINRQVVEVNRPENTCFERVLFFVDPDYYGLSEKTLQSKADDMLKKSYVKPPKIKRNGKAVLREMMKISAALVAGAAISASAIIFFF